MANYTDMSYPDLDKLWFEIKKQRELATGTPEYVLKNEEMIKIREAMEIKSLEWNTPERLAAAQKVHFVAPTLSATCVKASCGAKILGNSIFCHICGTEQN